MSLLSDLEFQSREFILKKYSRRKGNRICQDTQWNVYSWRPPAVQARAASRVGLAVSATLRGHTVTATASAREQM